MAFTWPDVLSGLVAGRDLPAEATGWAMDQILTGDATGAQIAGFVVALRCKGETVAEIAGMAEAMLNRATPIALDTEAVDIVGSGGDRANTVNVSTMAAVVAAACGARVVKHGNRAASSACGTADCLEALGIALDVAPERQARVLADAGIVFLFAPCTTRRCGTRAPPGANSGSRRPSTSSVRWPTRLVRGRRRWGWPTPGWLR